MAKDKEVDIPKELEKKYPLTSQNNVEYVDVRENLAPSDGLSKTAANRDDFFRQLFVLEKIFLVDDLQAIPANTDLSAPINASGFIGNIRRVKLVTAFGYVLKSSGIYEFSMNMPIEIVDGIERIELFLNITPKVGASYQIKVFDMGVGSGHAILDEIYEFYTITGSKMVYLGGGDAITFSAQYYNAGNASIGNITYKQGGTRDLSFVTQ